MSAIAGGFALRAESVHAPDDLGSGRHTTMRYCHPLVALAASAVIAAGCSCRESTPGPGDAPVGQPETGSPTQERTPPPPNARPKAGQREVNRETPEDARALMSAIDADLVKKGISGADASRFRAQFRHRFAAAGLAVEEIDAWVAGRQP